MVAECRSGFPQGDDFSVSGRIAVSQITVESAADDFALMNYDGAYRHFTQIERSLSGPQGLLHPQFVVFGSSAVPHEQYCMRMAAPQLLRKWIDPSPV